MIFREIFGKRIIYFNGKIKINEIIYYDKNIRPVMAISYFLDGTVYCNRFYSLLNNTLELEGEHLYYV